MSALRRRVLCAPCRFQFQRLRERDILGSYTDLSFRMLKCVGRPIPPHPGPLPEEREKHRPTLERFQDIRFADRLAAIRPLPWERAGARTSFSTPRSSDLPPLNAL